MFHSEIVGIRDWLEDFREISWRSDLDVDTTSIFELYTSFTGYHFRCRNDLESWALWELGYSKSIRDRYSTSKRHRFSSSIRVSLGTTFDVETTSRVDFCASSIIRNLFEIGARRRNDIDSRALYEFHWVPFSMSKRLRELTSMRARSFEIYSRSVLDIETTSTFELDTSITGYHFRCRYELDFRTRLELSFIMLLPSEKIGVCKIYSFKIFKKIFYHRIFIILLVFRST